MPKLASCDHRKLIVVQMVIVVIDVRMNWALHVRPIDTLGRTEARIGLKVPVVNGRVMSGGIQSSLCRTRYMMHKRIRPPTNIKAYLLNNI